MSKTTLKTPYIKPTRFKHSSGYRTFETGYCTTDDKNNAVDIEVIGTHSDHIFQDYMMLVGETPIFCLNMDLTNNGYIRLFLLDGKGKELRWSNDLGFSDMELTLKPAPDQAGGEA